MTAILADDCPLVINEVSAEAYGSNLSARGHRSLDHGRGFGGLVIENVLTWAGESAHSMGIMVRGGEATKHRRSSPD